VTISSSPTGWRYWPTDIEESYRWALETAVVITGAGRGTGREHAVLFAREGAKIVVNDLGGDNAGRGSDSGPAQQVVDETTATCGNAVANTENIATWSGAENVVQRAIDQYGRLDVLVNNAGILRDSFIAGMEESQWDAIAAHLKGHFAMLRHAAAYWKAQSKAGDQPNVAVINTASGSGVTVPNSGQADYGSVKSGIAALILIAAEELERCGVRVNAIAPIAHPGHPGHGRADGATRGGRTGLVQSGEHLSAGGLPGHRQMPGHRKAVCRPGRGDFAAGRVARRGYHPDRRALADRRYRGPAAALTGSS